LGNSVCSPDELKVQWKEVAGGEESTSHFSIMVSCFKAHGGVWEEEIQLDEEEK
jgi:hypothetical protein